MTISSLDLRSTTLSQTSCVTKMKLKLLALVLWMLPFPWSQAATIYENVEDDFTVEMDMSPSYITCDSGKGDAVGKEGMVKTEPEIVISTEVEDMFAEHGRHSMWNVYKFREDIKVDDFNFTQCALCSFHSIKCEEDPNTFETVCNRSSVHKGKRKGAVCEKHLVSFKLYESSGSNSRKNKEKEMFDESSTAINFPIGVRNKRSRDSGLMRHCPMPHPMTTSSVKCKAHPKFVKCTQHCLFGYTLEGGITENMQCNYTDGAWKPTGFKECKPFVDCTMVLTSGGKISCRSMSVIKPPECRVVCLAFEDKEAVMEQTYTCSIEGTWDPPLPFCVHPGSGLALVKVPSVRLHEDYEQK